MNAFTSTTQVSAPRITGATKERRALSAAGALFFSIILAAIGAVAALLLGAKWWSIAVAIAILAIAPIVILVLLSRKD